MPMPIFVLNVPLAAVVICLLVRTPGDHHGRVANGPADEYSLPLIWMLPGIRPITGRCKSRFVVARVTFST